MHHSALQDGKERSSSSGIIHRCPQTKSGGSFLARFPVREPWQKEGISLPKGDTTARPSGHTVRETQSSFPTSTRVLVPAELLKPSHATKGTCRRD